MTSITKHTKSLKYYVYTVLGIHVAGITALFPSFVFGLVFVITTFYILYKYVELVYQIEQSNRENLLMLISSTENESTRKILLQELWYADLHSLGGEPLNDIRS
tara:strand:- start:142 stop:453 length:312 start_codon:yes stop_codon:yes gene_type:complete